MQNVEIEMVL